MSSPALRRWIEAFLLGLAITAVGAWLWHCLCVFPAHGWNEIRLIPSFMLAHGVSPYPPAGTGPATTWIYGPVPLGLYLPAVLARDAAGALVIAGIVNAAIIVLAVVAVCAWLPAPRREDNRAGRLVAALICVALWPVTDFTIMQADNAAVAFGLISLLGLAKSDATGNRWLAAASCAAALACKQTLVGLVLAQCVFLFVRNGIRAAFEQGLRVAVLCGAGLALAVHLFGAEELWFHLIVLPAKLPWTDSLAGRVAAFWPYLLVHTVLPLGGIAFLGRHVWRSNSPWLLPALACATAWPLDLIALFKTGGSINSLHAGLFFLPFAATILATQFKAPAAWRAALASLTLSVLAFRLVSAAPGRWRPLLDHVHQGEFLARKLPGEVYFPWHPLITYYADKRFDHVEDGLLIYRLAGQPVAGAAVAGYLPPQFHIVAFRKNEMDWGIARTLIPPGSQVSDFGAWTLYYWPPGPAAAAPPAAPRD
jgi:hypothetical protein